MTEYSIFDIETDGLIENATKIHCVSVQRIKGDIIEKFTLTDYDSMRDFFLNEKSLIGHNIIRFDIPVVEKLLGITIKAELVDTLGLSFYLYPMRRLHGLESWGDTVGVEKPKIEDWENQTLQEYIYRCESDVEINIRVWNTQLSYLQSIYSDKGNYLRLIGYLNFKLQCAREQEETRWKLDKVLCKSTLELLIQERDKKIDALSHSMPPHIKYKISRKPKVLYKVDGTLSVNGEKWQRLVFDMGLPLEYEGTINTIVSSELGNPKSVTQLKDWLYSLGWQPCTFEYKKNKVTGEVKKIPQIYDDNGVSSSVKLLFEKTPELENLEGLTIINHRIGILEGFLRNVDSEGFLKAEIRGFTNTLRFQHTTINVYCGRKIA